MQNAGRTLRKLKHVRRGFERKESPKELGSRENPSQKRCQTGLAESQGAGTGAGKARAGRALTTRVRPLDDNDHNDHVLSVLIYLHPSSHGQATHTRAGLSDEGSEARADELEGERGGGCGEGSGTA